MATDFAELNDRVFLELGVAGEYCQVDKIHNAVIQKHNVRAMQSRASTINVLLGASIFTPTDLTHDLTAIIGKGLPAWVEFQHSDDTWQRMRVVPLPQLADYGTLGELVASFSAEEAASSATEPVQYIHFSLIPRGDVRIRFDRDNIRMGLKDNMLLPDFVGELIVKEAQNMVIPRIKLAIDVRTNSDPTLANGVARALKQSLAELATQNAADIHPLYEMWKGWAFKDRAGEASFNKATPSSRGAYGNG